MTLPREAPSEAACSQVFTERHGEFTFRNDTVTAFDPDWDPLKSLAAKSAQPDRRKPAGRRTLEAVVVVAALIKSRV
jgi:hypothetical protein